MFKLRIGWNSVINLGKYLLVTAIIVAMGYFAYLAYYYGTNVPYEVRVTNVTGNSATVSWYTHKQDAGVVAVKTSNWFVPLFNQLGSKLGFDDRDVAVAQKDYVDDLAKKIQKDSTINVDSSDLSNVKVAKKGKYYVHHVTITGLSENTNYSFRVGNGFFWWNVNKDRQEYTKEELYTVNSFEFKTYQIANELKTPNPAYGRIYSLVKNKDGFVMENKSTDSLVFVKAIKFDNSYESNVLSNVTNTNGGWNVDKANFRKSDGSESPDFAIGKDNMSIYLQFEDLAPKSSISVKFGTEDTPVKGIYGNDDGTARIESSLLEIFKDRIKSILSDSITGEFVYKTLAAGTDPYANACQAGYHYVPVNRRCVKDGTVDTKTCPDGYDWSKSLRGCVKKDDPLFENRQDDIVTIDPLRDYSSSGTGSGGNNSAPDEKCPQGYLQNEEGNWYCNSYADMRAGMKCTGQYARGCEIDSGCFCSFGDGGYARLKDMDCRPVGCANPNTTGRENDAYWYTDDSGNLMICPQQAISSASEQAKSCQKGSSVAVSYNGHACTCQDESCGSRSGEQKTVDCTGEKYTPPAGSGSGSGSSSGGGTEITCSTKAVNTANQGKKVKNKADCCLTGYTCTNTGELISAPLKGSITCSSKALNNKGKVVLSSADCCLEGYVCNSVGEWQYTSTGAPACDTSNFYQLVNDSYSSASIPVYRCVESQSGTRSPGCTDPAKPVLMVGSDGTKTCVSEDKFKVQMVCCDIGSGSGLWITSGKCSAEYTGQSLDNIACGHQADGSLNSNGVCCQSKNTGNVQWYSNMRGCYGFEDYVGNSESSCKTQQSQKACCLYNDKYYWEENNNCSGSVIKGLDERACDAKNGGTNELKKVCYQSPSGSLSVENYGDVKNSPGTITNKPVSECGYCCLDLNKGGYIKSENKCPSGAESSQSYSKCSGAVQGVSTSSVLGTSDTNDYVRYFPEAGLYNVVQAGRSDYISLPSKGSSAFYIERNGTPGYQEPQDSNNVSQNEDLLVKMASSDIQVKKVQSGINFKIYKGINVISFPVMVTKDGQNSLTAKELLQTINVGKPIIEYITYFEGGAWRAGLVYKSSDDTKIAGNDFPLTVGRGYLIKSNFDAIMTLPAYDLKSSVPVALSAGWNLVGINGYDKTYTAGSLIDSINGISGLNATNVTWWPTSKGRYESFQKSEGVEYGFDYPILNNMGYFIRINAFKPEDKNAKSLIWNPGGDLHGQPGSTN